MKTYKEFILEARRLKMVRMYHGTSKSSADKIKNSGFNTSDVYASTNKDIARSFGNRKGEDTKVVSLRVPTKSINTPGKVMKTSGQRGIDNWGRQHYSTVINPKYAEKHISKEDSIIHSPKIPITHRKRYFESNPNSKFKRRTKTQPKKR